MRASAIVTDAEFEQARAAHGTAQSDVDLWETRLDFTRVISPTAGVVTAKLVEAGSAVAVNQRLFDIADDSLLVVRVQMSELDVVHVRRGVAVARFSRTLSTLLASGVPLLSAMAIVKNVLGNRLLEKIVNEATGSIREGDSIADPLRRSGEFPPMVTHMIAVGERTGQLEEMLENVSRAYEADVETKVTTLTSLLEPLVIVVMGGMVGFIAMAILMPLVQMNNLVE
jgi:hypothetical protein